MNKNPKPRPNQPKPARFLHTPEDLHNYLEEALAAENNADRTRKVADAIALPGNLQPTPEHVQQARAAIARLVAPSDAYHQVVVRWMDKKNPPEFLKRIARSICAEDRERLVFPPYLADAQEPSDFGLRVRQWLESLPISRKASTARKKDLNPDDERIDAALALSAWRCLAYDREQSYFPGAVMHLILLCLKQYAGDFRDSSAWIFGTEKYLPSNLQRLRPLLDNLNLERERAIATAAELEKQKESEANQRRELQLQLLSEQEKSRSLEESLQHLSGELAAAKREVERVTAEANAREARLTETMRAERLRIVQKVRQVLSHETNELHVWLEREQPNVKVALARVRNIERLNAGLAQGIDDGQTDPSLPM